MSDIATVRANPAEPRHRRIGPIQSAFRFMAAVVLCLGAVAAPMPAAATCVPPTNGTTADATQITDCYAPLASPAFTGSVGIDTASPPEALTVNGLISGGFGTRTTAGTLDWNDVTNARSGSGHTLLLGTATNGPGPSAYFHPFSFEYVSKDGSGNLTQFAVPYGASSSINSGIYLRGRYSDTWTNWVHLLSTDTAGNMYLPGTGVWTSSGSVGVGTTSPSYKFYVNGTAGGTSAWSSSSDARLKKNIVAISGALRIIEGLQGVRFDWRAPDERTVGKSLNLPTAERQIGFIAQQVKQVLPEAVVTARDDEALMSVRESKVVPVLVEAVKQLAALNRTQAAEIRRLQQRVSALEHKSSAHATRTAANLPPE